MRSLHLKGWALCRLLLRFGYFGSVCFDEHFQHRSQHSSSRTAHKTRKILAIQSIHKRYWIGKVKGSVEQWVEGLSSEIACVGLSFRNRNSSRAERVGSEFSEFSECHWSAIEWYLQFYVQNVGPLMTTLQRVDLQVYSSSDCAKLHEKRIHFSNVCGGVPGGYKAQCSGQFKVDLRSFNLEICFRKFLLQAIQVILIKTRSVAFRFYSLSRRTTTRKRRSSRHR